jgi:hypothetical protein
MSELGPKRGQYLGRYTVDPTPTAPGQWWFNTTEAQWKYWDGLQTFSGKHYSGSATVLIGAGVTTQPLDITITGPTAINYIVDVRCHATPFTGVVAMNHVTIGSVVGVTLWAAANPAGLTVVVDALILGY